MNQPVFVQIIGAPIACKDGVKLSWRSVAQWVTCQLKGYFDDAVQVKYYDVSDPDCPSMPVGAKLPLVLVNGEVTRHGRKISVPAIRRKIRALLERETP